jgi:peptidoglycan-N-acetylglucosamine deacetylase
MGARNAAIAVTATLSALMVAVPAQAAPGGACGSGYVRLTFDDGPSRDVTPVILDTLAARKATATFFVIGEMADASPDLVRRASAEGHRIGNHSWDHADLTTLDGEQVEAELRSTNQEIVEATGAAPAEWRPPFGNTNADLESVAEGLGLTSTVLWTVDSGDWQNPPATTIRDRVLQQVRADDIVLLHDAWTQSTAEALPMILDGLTERGFCTR